MKRNFFSLRYKVMIFIFSLVLILLGALVTFFYTNSNDLLVKKISDSNLNTVIQIANNIDFIIEEVHDVSLDIIQDSVIRDVMKRKDIYNDVSMQSNMYKNLISHISQKGYIQSIHIENSRNKFVTTTTTHYISPQDYKKADELNGRFFWKDDTVIDYPNTEIDTLSLIRRVNDIDEITNRLGYLKISIKKDVINEIYSSKDMNSEGEYFLIDSSGNVIVGNENKVLNDIVAKQKYYFEKEVGYEEYYYDTQPYIITYQKLKDLDWYQIHIISEKKLYSDIYMLRELITYGVLIGILVTLVSVTLITKWILGPLTTLGKMMGEIEKENFDVTIEARGNDEIFMVVDRFNKMSSRLKQLLQEVYIRKIHEKEAQIMALQAQINPHFLYNTLDAIYWNSRLEKAYKTSDLVMALSTHFRHSLNQGECLTNLKKEIEHIQSYIKIQEERYDEQITFEIKIGNNIIGNEEKYVVVNLLLQPLIENAIIHGFEDVTTKGKIKISIFTENNDLIYIVEDNGRGCDMNKIKEALERKDQSKVFALNNLVERIQFIHGQAYGMEFTSYQEVGTLVKVTQPINRI